MMDQHHMMCFHHSVKESNSMSVVRHLRESKYIKHGFGEATICGLHRLADLDDDQHGLNHPAPSADGDPCGCWNLQQLLLLNRHRRGCTLARSLKENFGILKSALFFIATWINTRIC